MLSILAIIKQEDGLCYVVLWPIKISLTLSAIKTNHLRANGLHLKQIREIAAGQIGDYGKIGQVLTVTLIGLHHYPTLTS